MREIYETCNLIFTLLVSDAICDGNQNNLNFFVNLLKCAKIIESHDGTRGVLCILFDKGNIRRSLLLEELKAA
jgi:hypothetical protein